MNRSGFTLVELLVAIAIIGILTTISTLQFSSYLRKGAIERQTRELYGDMVELRSKAAFEKQSRLLRLTSAGYSLYSTGNTTANPVAVVTFKVPITFNNGGNIRYDTKGILLREDRGSVCVAEENSAPVDSIVLSLTRIQLGKRDVGEACAENKVVAK